MSIETAVQTLEAAKARLADVERATQADRNQGLLLNTALRAGTLSRSSEAWQPFDAAQRQFTLATEEVAEAEEALKAAQRRQQGQLRAEAEGQYRATPEGAAIVKEIDRLQTLYADAAAKELGSAASYSHGLSIERGRFNENVSKVLSSMQPEPTAAKAAAPSRLTPEMLRACYLNDGSNGIGRVLPPGVTLEIEDYPALQSFRESLRAEMEAEYRAYRDYEADDEMRGRAFDDPRTLPMRQARQRYGELHSAVQWISNDIESVRRRANDSGQYL